jgi:hypothetical protein
MSNDNDIPTTRDEDSGKGAVEQDRAGQETNVSRTCPARTWTRRIDSSDARADSSPAKETANRALLFSPRLSADAFGSRAIALLMVLSYALSRACQD